MKGNITRCHTQAYAFLHWMILLESRFKFEDDSYLGAHEQNSRPPSLFEDARPHT